MPSASSILNVIKPVRRAGRVTRLGALLAAVLLGSAAAHAQTKLVPPQPDLTGVLNTATTDGKTARQWAIVLGKALFWDQQAGSDGVACASCHYNAGADVRLTNQLSPGAKDLTVSATGDRTFGSRRTDTGSVAPGALPSGTPAAPNVALKEADFPLHRLSNERDRNSALHSTTNDVVSSQGAFAAPFVSVNATTGKETCGTASADVFHVGTMAARQVANRNAPTTINAAFNRRLNWDGAANNLFNGVGGFGLRDIVGDANKRLIVLNASAQAELGHVALKNAALASQAVSPILDSTEMSCAGRKMADVGRKLLAPNLRPLATQKITPTDSAFAGLVDVSGKGLPLTHRYAELVKRAFDPKYWSATGRYTVADGKLTTVRTGGYTQMEHNWSLFWGVSIMLYEATLISNVSEFDGLVARGELTVRDIRSGPPFGCTANGAIDPLLLRGCQIFFQTRDPQTSPPGGGCNGCHGGRDLFTNAASQPQQKTVPLLQLGTILDVPADLPGFSDVGFQNNGTRPSFTDLKNAATDPYGHPLSYALQYSRYLKAIAAGQTAEQAMAAHIVDPDLKTAIETNGVFIGIGSADFTSKLNTGGASKVPTMRNIALTPPYASSGEFASLRQILKFYNRESNRRNISPGSPDALGTACTDGDTSGTGADGQRTFAELQSTPQTCHTNIQVGLGTINLLDCEIAGSTCDSETDDLSALIRFFKSLSDPRVQCDAAPFDHPSLNLTVGHRAFDRNGDGRADDLLFELPAVGAAGYDPASGYCIPNSGNLFAAGMQGRVGGTRVPLAAAR